MTEVLTGTAIKLYRVYKIFFIQNIFLITLKTSNDETVLLYYLVIWYFPILLFTIFRHGLEQNFNLKT